jgi:hypothetical protein
MKTALTALVALLLLASCAKIKDRKAWKQWYGSYTLSHEIQLFENFHGDTVYADQLSINKYGISFTHSNDNEPSCVFSRLENESIPGYDYQLKFEEIRLFVFGEESGQLASPSESELNADKEYLLKRVDDNKVLFRIETNGQMYQNVQCSLN